MRGPDLADRIFRELYPFPETDDDKIRNLYEHADMHLVRELRTAISMYHGSIDNLHGRRRPGVDYADRGWRMRLSFWPHHFDLFRAFDKFNLTQAEIRRVCTWWGTVHEINNHVITNPSIVIPDDTWDGMQVCKRMGSPRAVFHNIDPMPPISTRRQTNPSIEPCSGLQTYAVQNGRGTRPSTRHAPSGNTRVYSLDSTSEGSFFLGVGDRDVLQQSVGNILNQQLPAGGRSPAFDEWFKDELESGSLLSTISSPSPFRSDTNTISYTSPHSVMRGYPTYSQRAFAGHQAISDFATLAVAVSDPSESSRRLQPPQTSLSRYRTTPYRYRPLRPRPARSSSHS